MSLSYYQPPEPLVEDWRLLYCTECGDDSEHELTGWVRGITETRCLECGHEDEIELE
jgi:hypothetical protein